MGEIDGFRGYFGFRHGSKVISNFKPVLGTLSLALYIYIIEQHEQQ